MDFAALQHSVFLQALGSAILNSLWQCFILWFIYETISVSYKAASARFKNNLATLLLFFSFGWFLTSFFSKIFNQHHLAAAAAIPTGLALELKEAGHSVSAFSEFLSYASATLPYLSVAYIFLLLFLTSRLFAAYRYVYLISNKRLMNPTTELQFFATKVAAEIGITKKISVWISNHIDVPATIGFFKPVILIPVASVNNLSAQQLEAIILHELAHIRRNDYVTNLIISIIETILFFNPFVVLLSNIIKRERENCCDDFVLQYRYDPHSYASALLRLEQSRVNKLKLAIGAVSGKKQLLSRIKRITNRQVVARQFNYGQKIMALVLVTGIICSVAWLSPEEKKSVTQKPFAKANATFIPKVSPADKAQIHLELAVTPAKPIENLPSLGMKHPLPKIEAPAAPALPEVEGENSSSDNASADSDDNDQFDLTVSGSGTNVDGSEMINAKQPEFSFDEKDFKLPSFAGVQNFLLQNMKLNIDLSKIDVSKLDKNLKQAYKEINAVDWNKVENDIRRSFAKMKPGKLSKKDQDALFENINPSSRINVIRAEKLYNTKAMLEVIKKQIVNDSLHILEMALPNTGNIKIQRTFNQRPRNYGRNENPNGNHYYFNYSSDTKITDDENDNGEITSCDKVKTISTTGKKTIQITIKRGQGNVHTGVLNAKKGFQFYLSKDDDERPNQESVLSVEVKD